MMTPEELQELLNEFDTEPSWVAFQSGIDRGRVRAFLKGDGTALTQEERSTLREKLTAPEHHQSANIAEQSAVIDGAGEFLRKHSVLFMYEKSGERTSASGTLVQIGDRLLVATARHTIPRGSQMLEFIGANMICVDSSPEVAPGKRIWTGQRPAKVVNGKRHQEFDVGLIELESSALSVLGHEAIPLSGISIRTPQFGRTAFVYGFPSEFERSQKISESSGFLRVGSMTYPNPVLAPEEWPHVPDHDTTPEESVDCFMRYCRDDEMKAIVPIGRNRGLDLSGFPERLPAVHGMSGGGFWQRWTPVNDRELWLACDYELFAIQSSWYEPSRYIRGVQIRHWLDLVAESYPDLKPMIDEHIVCQDEL